MYKSRVHIYSNHVPFDARQKSYGFTRHLKFAILSPTNVDSMPCFESAENRVCCSLGYGNRASRCLLVRVKSRMGLNVLRSFPFDYDSPYLLVVKEGREEGRDHF